MIHEQIERISKMIATIGTSDQPCWLAEACKTPSLEGLRIYGVTVYRNRSYCSDRIKSGFAAAAIFGTPWLVESLNFRPL